MGLQEKVEEAKKPENSFFGKAVCLFDIGMRYLTTQHFIGNVNSTLRRAPPEMEWRHSVAEQYSDRMTPVQFERFMEDFNRRFVYTKGSAYNLELLMGLAIKHSKEPYLNAVR